MMGNVQQLNGNLSEIAGQLKSLQEKFPKGTLGDLTQLIMAFIGSFSKEAVKTNTTEKKKKKKIRKGSDTDFGSPDFASVVGV